MSLSVRELRVHIRNATPMQRMELAAALLEEMQIVKDGQGEKAIEWMKSTGAQALMAGVQLQALADQGKALMESAGAAKNLLEGLFGK